MLARAEAADGVAAATRLALEHALDAVRNELAGAALHFPLNALAATLGTSNPRESTVKAIKAVLFKHLWPERMGCFANQVDFCRSQGCSVSNFTQWQHKIDAIATATVSDTASALLTLSDGDAVNYGVPCAEARQVCDKQRAIAALTNATEDIPGSDCVVLHEVGSTGEMVSESILLQENPLLDEAVDLTLEHRCPAILGALAGELTLKGVEHIKAAKDLVNYHHFLRESNEDLCDVILGSEDNMIEKWRRQLCEMRECQVEAEGERERQQAITDVLGAAATIPGLVDPRVLSAQRLREEQLLDADCQRVFRELDLALHARTEGADEAPKELDFVVRDGLLFKRVHTKQRSYLLVFAPTSVRTEILRALHDGAGHRGVTATLTSGCASLHGGHVSRNSSAITSAAAARVLSPSLREFRLAPRFQ
jgi:hypothetical protein